MTQFMDDVNNAIHTLTERLNALEATMTYASDQITPSAREKRIKLDESIVELFAIRAAVELPNTNAPSRELRKRLHHVLWENGLLDPKNPRSWRPM